MSENEQTFECRDCKYKFVSNVPFKYYVCEKCGGSAFPTDGEDMRENEIKDVCLACLAKDADLVSLQTELNALKLAEEMRENAVPVTIQYEDEFKRRGDEIIRLTVELNEVKDSVNKIIKLLQKELDEIHVSPKNEDMLVNE